MPRRPRVHVMHGVNLDQLGRRDPEHYGRLELFELERQVEAYARELEVEVSFFQSNHEAAYVGELHRVDGFADALLLNPGAWTHYAWSIHDALELARLPAVEVHLSDVERREPWRRQSVIRDLCVGTVSGRGVEGYRDGLARLKAAVTG